MELCHFKKILSTDVIDYGDGGEYLVFYNHQREIILNKDEIKEVSPINWYNVVEDDLTSTDCQFPFKEGIPFDDMKSSVIKMKNGKVFIIQGCTESIVKAINSNETHHGCPCLLKMRHNKDCNYKTEMIVNNQ